MASTETQVVKLMAKEIMKAIKEYVGDNNKTYVNTQIANHAPSGSGSSGSGGEFSGNINASQITGLYPTVAGFITNAQNNAAQGDSVAGQIITTLTGIAAIEIGSATIGTAQIEDLYASYGEFFHLVAENAEITDLNTERFKADIAKLGMADIGSADIGFAQIKDLVSGSAIIREGVGGHLFIDRLNVTDANMVSLTTGELMLKDKDGNFVRITVDEDGNVGSEKVTFSGGNILINNSVAGSKLIENTITARELNVSQIFADEALIGAIKAANIDVGSLVANDAFINKIVTGVISSPTLGEDIDISKNATITLTNSKIDFVVKDGDREGSFAITDQALRAIADKIDLSANNTIKITVDDNIDLSGNTTIKNNATVALNKEKIDFIVNKNGSTGAMSITNDALVAIANNIDLSANDTVTITADAINQVANSINLSGNHTITFNTSQLKAIADGIDLSSNHTMTFNTSQLTAIANNIDLSSNTTVTITADKINEIADKIDLSGNQSITLSAEQLNVISRSQQLIDKIQSEINSKGYDNSIESNNELINALRSIIYQNFKFDNSGMTVGKFDGNGSAKSIWTTVTNNEGFMVRNSTVTGIDGNGTVFKGADNGVIANGYECGEMRVRKSRNGWVWTDKER